MWGLRGILAKKAETAGSMAFWASRRAGLLQRASRWLTRPQASLRGRVVSSRARTTLSKVMRPRSWVKNESIAAVACSRADEISDWMASALSVDQRIWKSEVRNGCVM